VALDRVRRVVVGRVEEIPPGERRIVTPFRGRAGIGVFNVNGTYSALRNLCPHKRGPLCTGRVSGRVVADAPPSSGGAYSGAQSTTPLLAVERDGEIIRCPWHLWEFEIATGRCLVDPRARVKTYPVAIEEGQVVVYAAPADVPSRDVSAAAVPFTCT
jgi:3-phenylpropionate/trans-cinnamate dioxygenase ferredoxin subunit